MLRVLASRTAQQLQRQSAAAAAAHCRCFAEASAVASPAEALDWDDLSTHVYSDSGKRELQQLRTTFLDIKQKLGELSQEPPVIDWAAWKKELDPELVTAFEKAYTTMPLPKYENSEVGALEEQFRVIVKQAEELSAHSEQRLKELEEELKAVQSEKDKISSITVDEVLASDPEIATAIDEDIKKGDFLP